jgi:excisionase family DNA binding protein
MEGVVLMGDLIQFPQRREAERWMTKLQAARHLGVSTRWVEMRARDAGLPSYMVGGMRRYKATELDAWVRGRGPDVA